MKTTIIGSVLIGAVAGIVLMLGAEGAYHYSSSDEFCSTSCHSMQTYVANDEHFLQSIHRNTSTGIEVGCSDCHVPPTFPDNVIYKTTSGIKDIYVELTNDFTDPKNWEARRDEITHSVRDWFIETNSASCKSCHAEDKLKPKRESAQRQHELAERDGITCIGCHYNLVHKPVKPTKEFAEYGRVSADMTRLAAQK